MFLCVSIILYCVSVCFSGGHGQLSERCREWHGPQVIDVEVRATELSLGRGPCLARALRLCEISPVPQLVPCTLADAVEVGSDFDFEIYPAW